MGHFYTNVTVKSVPPARVARQMRDWGRCAVITPQIGDYVVVFDGDSERQDGTVTRLAFNLSKDLHCLAYAITNHDDSVLYASLWHAGRKLDEYNSKPNYFHGSPGAPPLGGDAAVICAAIGCPQAEPRLKAVVSQSEGYVFEIDRHRDVVSTLGLPDVAVGGGFEYLMAGRGPAGLDLDACLLGALPEDN